MIFLENNINNYQNEKINIILDFANTIIFSFLDDQKTNINTPQKANEKLGKFEKYNNNEKFYIIDIKIKGNDGKSYDIFSFFTFRNGTEEFFRKSKPFCDFYVNYNLIKEYVGIIAQKIEVIFEIKNIYIELK